MNIYRNKRVFVTGHTGFKGQWLVRALKKYGALVEGYSLPDDVTCFERLHGSIRRFAPDIVFHLAAQALVPVSFVEPLRTIDTNVMGTANLLEALRLENRPCAVVVVTSDKCYLPKDREWTVGDAHVETDHLGGHDPYASSKAGAEFVVEAYRTGFFAPDHRIAVATARAGNVIGGGDWAFGRLIPNAVRALRAGKPIPVWNRHASRPWQYIEDVIEGYLLLGEALAQSNRARVAAHCAAWNFGPDESHTVREVVERVIKEWGTGTWEQQDIELRETFTLRVNSMKARTQLGWQPHWGFETAIHETIKWYKEHHE